MSIEFHCTRCSRLLRTPAGTSGRQTQCPECGEALTVPVVAPAPGTFAQAGAGEANPYQSPAASVQLQQAAPGELVPMPLELGDVLSRSWTIFQSQFGMVVLGVFLAGLINAVPQWFANGLIAVLEITQVDPVLVMTLRVVLTLAFWLFQIWVTLGELAYLLHIARGGRPEIGMLFTGSRYFVSGLLATLLFFLMLLAVTALFQGPAGIVYLVTGNQDQALIALLIGLPFFTIAAIWISMTFSYFQLAIVDRQCGPLEALSLSRQFTRGNKLTVFALFIVMIGLGFAGFLACCIGAIFTTAYSMLAVFPVAWLCMTGQPTGDRYLLPRVAGPIVGGPLPGGPLPGGPGAGDEALRNPPAS
jgi:hypothetical protein